MIKATDIVYVIDCDYQNRDGPREVKTLNGYYSTIGEAQAEAAKLNKQKPGWTYFMFNHRARATEACNVPLWRYLSGK